MPHTSELFRRVRETVLRHVYERQVVAGKWGVDFFWARKDIARLMSRPGHKDGPLADMPSSVRARRFDWGFEVTFQHVIEKLAEDEILEVRTVSAIAGGRGNTLRIRDYKLTDEGIRLCEETFGPILPGEQSAEHSPSDVADEHAGAPGADAKSDTESDVEIESSQVVLPDLDALESGASDSTAEIDMERAIHVPGDEDEDGEGDDEDDHADEDDDIEAHRDRDARRAVANADTAPLPAPAPEEWGPSDVTLTEMPAGRRPDATPDAPSPPAAVTTDGDGTASDSGDSASASSSSSGRRSPRRDDSPSGRQSAINN